MEKTDRFRSVRFGFDFLSLEPNRKNQKKPSQTEKNQAKTEPNRFGQVFVLKNQTEPIRNQSVWTGFGFFKKKIRFGYIFLIKTEPNRKWTLPLISTKLITSSMVHWGIQLGGWYGNGKDLKGLEVFYG